MVDSGTGEIPIKTNAQPVQIDRRTLFKLGFGLLATGLVTAACGGKDNQVAQQQQERPAQPRPPEAPPTPAEAKPSAQTLQYIEAGRNMVTPEDRKMFEEAVLGVDLPFFRNPRAQEILRIPVNSDARQRVLAAIGFLDVERNPLYNGGKYACNSYALTLTRFLLSDDIIGSRYRATDGAPWVLSRSDTSVDWAEPGLPSFSRQYPALDANNIDWWLTRYGSKLGWQAAAPADADRLMKTGQYMGIAATSQAYVSEQTAITLERQKKDPTIPPFSGHMAVLVPGGSRDEYGVSQATNNYTFRGLKKPEPLYGPEYRVHLIKVPATSWIDQRMGK